MYELVTINICKNFRFRVMHLCGEAILWRLCKFESLRIKVAKLYASSREAWSRKPSFASYISSATSYPKTTSHRIYRPAFFERLTLIFYVHGSVHRESMSIIVQQDGTIYNLLYFCWLLYLFRVVPQPIIRSTHNCIYSIWYLSNRFCYLPL